MKRDLPSSARGLSKILVTGGAGFIGSHVVRHLLGQDDRDLSVVNVDLLTYAGNLENLEDVAEDPRYRFVQADIRDVEVMRRLLEESGADTIVHLAAESHVDRSIHTPADFVTTNVVGTFALLEAARAVWDDREDVLFHHVSTDEVYGSLGETGSFSETTPYDPRSPYSASKAASDHLVRAYGHTYGLPILVTNCSNNYGPYQYPEKLIPVVILSLLDEGPVPVYGDGGNVRDWLHVEDHAAALWHILQRGRTGETYNVGASNEWKNLDLVHRLCDLVAAQEERDPAEVRRLVTFVEDRKGHDRRYAIDSTKLREELGWVPERDFEAGLAETVAWYRGHRDWVERRGRLA